MSKKDLIFAIIIIILLILVLISAGFFYFNTFLGGIATGHVIFNTLNDNNRTESSGEIPVIGGEVIFEKIENVDRT